QLQIAHERHPPIGIGHVAALETGAAQGVTSVGPARAHVGVEAIGDAGQIDGRRGELGPRGASFRRHWRDLARLWRIISRPSSLSRPTSSGTEYGGFRPCHANAKGTGS